MKAKVKHYVILRFGYDCFIHCFPGQIWQVKELPRGEYSLSRNNVDMALNDEKYKKYFEEV